MPDSYEELTPFEFPSCAHHPDGSIGIVFACHDVDDGGILLRSIEDLFHGHAVCTDCDGVWHFDFDPTFLKWGLHVFEDHEAHEGDTHL